MKKILFIQIAKTPVAPDDNKENIPFAAGAIAAYLKEKKFEGRVIIPDHKKTDLYGDARLVDMIVREKPSWLFLTTYMWNIERSLYIAHEVKRMMASCKIVIGGPEVSKDNSWIFKNSFVDHFVIGEGEEAAFALLSGREKRKAIDRYPPLTKYFSPYISGTLKMDASQPVYIEAQRGCPFGCAFCYYPKGRKKVLSMGLERIAEILEMARRAGVREIVFLDPTFNNHPYFSSLLDLLIEKNKTGMFKYNAEIKPHILSTDQIKKLNRAGFKTLEVGLQTIHKKTQVKIDCLIEPTLFSAKLNKLSKKIRVRLDLILGLPSETKEDVRKSLAYVRKFHKHADHFLYHLSILPGTKLRQSIPQSKYQQHPPYFITDSGSMKIKEMLDASKQFEKIFGEDLDPLPEMSNIYSKRKDMNYLLFTKDNIGGAKIKFRKLPAFNVVEFRSNSLDNLFFGRMLANIHDMTRSNPFCTFLIFVNIPHINQVKVTEDILRHARVKTDQYANNCRILHTEEIATLRIGFIS